MTIMKCSFCGKTKKEVKMMVRKEDGTICDECISACNSVIMEKRMDMQIEGLAKAISRSMFKEFWGTDV